MSAMKRYDTVEEYIKSLPKEQQKAVNEIRSCILDAVPEAEEVPNYAIAAYALVKGGKAEKQVMIGAYKNHLGFYPHPTTIEHFADELKEYKYTKGTVQIPYDKPMPKDLIIRMVKYRKELIDKGM